MSALLMLCALCALCLLHAFCVLYTLYTPCNVNTLYTLCNCTRCVTCAPCTCTVSRLYLMNMAKLCITFLYDTLFVLNLLCMYHSSVFLIIWGPVTQVRVCNTFYCPKVQDNEGPQVLFAF